MKRNISERNKEDKLNGKENKSSSSLRSEEMFVSLKRVTRNSFKQLENVLTNKVLGRKTRSSTNEPFENKPKLLPLSKCPYVKLKGDIKYFSNFDDISKICRDLYTHVEFLSINSEVVPISFDMEWPFNFKTGPSKTSVIQLSVCKNICHVFSVGEMIKIPDELVNILEHPKVRLYGVNIKNDLRKLQRDFATQINSDMLVEKCIDLGTMHNEINNASGRWSLEKLVNKLCRLQIDKSMKIRMSKWNVIPLEEHQLKYAAIDVYIGRVIYEKLKSLKEENELKRKVIETDV